MNGSIGKYDHYKKLQEYSGGKKYEIVTLINPDEEVKDILLDSVTTNMIIQAKYDPIKLEDYYSYTLKANNIGSKIDISKTNRIIKDGTNWYWKEYTNWIINGDTSKHSYIRPLTKNEEKDPDKWIEVFRDLYSKASSIYIYEGLGEYYFKVDKTWYKLGYNKEADNAFNERFPAKFDTVRMIELEDRSPSYVVPPEERDSSLIKQVDYESVFEKEVESAGGWTSSIYSAGWWYMQVYMPGGDTLKIKRFSSYRGPDMKLYKIPEQYGGRKDVLFIVLQPKRAHPEQVGGMYVVRPRGIN